MRKLSLTLYLMLGYLSAFAQRDYSGYGRGIDWEWKSSPNIGFSDFLFGFIIFIIVAIGVTMIIIEKINNKRKIASGKYIKVVRQGHIEIEPINKYSQSIQVMQIWKLNEFENLFGSLEFHEEPTNRFDEKRLISISCNNKPNNILINVNFKLDCTSNYFFKNMKVYRIAKVKNGKYFLCYKE